MNREEILEKSRQENDVSDERTKYIGLKGSNFSVGVLIFLWIALSRFWSGSISGYHAWLKRVPSNTEKRREAVKAKIKDIYERSNKIMVNPKSPGSYVDQEKSSPSVLLVSI